MKCLTRMWLRCTRPRLMAEIRYGQRIIDRIDGDTTPDERIMLRILADNAHRTIDALLADVIADYSSATPFQRHLIADTEQDATTIMRRLTTAANRISKETR